MDEYQPAATTPVVEPPAARGVQSGLGQAVAAFCLLFGAQLASGLVAMLIAIVLVVQDGATIEQVVGRLTARMGIPTLIATAVGSVAALLVAIRIWPETWRSLVVRPRWSVVAAWAGAGAVAAAIYLSVVLWVVPPDPSVSGGPLAAAAAAGGFSRLLVAILAVLVAPVVEEFFFRGLMLDGFRSRWGTRTAGVAVTILFVLLHLFETFNYWPAIVAILTLAGAALAARLRTGSLVPAIALHTSYNSVIVAGVYLGG